MKYRSVVNNCGSFYGIQAFNESTHKWETIPSRVLSTEEETKIMETPVIPQYLRDNALPED